MQVLARRSVLVLVMTALLGRPSGLWAEHADVPPESVGFWTDGLKAFQRTMRALVNDRKLASITTLVARHGKIVYLDAYGIQIWRPRSRHQRHDFASRR